MCSARSRTGLTVTWVLSLPHHWRICSVVNAARISWTRARLVARSLAGVQPVTASAAMWACSTSCRRGTRGLRGAGLV